MGQPAATCQPLPPRASSHLAPVDVTAEHCIPDNSAVPLVDVVNITAHRLAWTGQTLHPNAGAFNNAPGHGSIYSVKATALPVPSQNMFNTSISPHVAALRYHVHLLVSNMSYGRTHHSESRLCTICRYATQNGTCTCYKPSD
jgi:hypothetical protein